MFLHRRKSQGPALPLSFFHKWGLLPPYRSPCSLTPLSGFALSGCSFPAHVRETAESIRASHLRRVPGVLRFRHRSEHTFHTGANHGALRHPREARLTPQEQASSRERSQRYSRRATSGGPARRSRGKGYIKGIFWYFLLLVTKSTTRDGPTSGIALTSTATTPCQGPCACGRRNVCAPHGPCQKLAEPIACQRLPA